MNTFLNIGFINFLKEFDKCYMFSFSVLPKNKNSTTFYMNTVVFKQERTPKLENGMKVFIKGSISQESYMDTTNTSRTIVKLYADSIEIISENNSQKKRNENVSIHSGEKTRISVLDTDDFGNEIPF